jgi:nicotinamide phosphoribosyltransferase
MNPMTLIDVYKIDHRRQYPQGTTRVYSNWTPRSSRISEHGEVVFFGAQYFFRRFLEEDFNQRFFGEGEARVCERYARRTNSVLGPNSVGADHIRALHQLGYIPLEFRALAEGTAVPLRVPMLTVENTHPDFFWLPNYFETLMSSVLWQPCTSATTALGMRRILDAAAKKTGSDPGFVDWQGHDFSFRGLPGPEAAALSGAGHLLYFTGTDTLPSLDLIEDYYGVPEGYLVGGSVAATEHSVMCAGGEYGERATFDRLLDLYPSGILSVVSDTWDLWYVVTQIVPSLKERILAREGKLVIRPDSGNPADIICGDPKATGSAANGVVELLWDTFGGTTTTTGHRLLDGHIGCIYGDSITMERATEITDRLAAKGFASANVVFGIGSYSYQYVTRDTYGFAMKATWVKINGEGRDIYKTPKTDDGVKNSARGRLAVVYGDDGNLRLIEKATPDDEAKSLLEVVWRNGKSFRSETFDVIRKRARLALR